MAEQFSCVPSWLVAAKNMLEVATHDAVDQDLQGIQIQLEVEKSELDDEVKEGVFFDF